MKRLAVVVIAVAAVAAACSSSGEDVPTRTFLQGSYEVAEGSMRYLVWLPEGYGEDRDREWPLLVFLHGSGDPEYDSEYVLSVGLPAVLLLEEEPDNFEFVVLAPQANPGTAWWSPGQLDLLDGVVTTALDTYLVDPDRVYLTGLSMGGYGSWWLATSYPGKYAALVSISGSGYQSETLPDEDFTCDLAETPVWGIHGQQDLISEYPINERLINRYATLCDAEVRWTAYPDAGHFEAFARGYRDPAVYDWLLAQNRGG